MLRVETNTHAQARNRTSAQAHNKPPFALACCMHPCIAFSHLSLSPPLCIYVIAPSSCLTPLILRACVQNLYDSILRDEIKLNVDLVFAKAVRRGCVRTSHFSLLLLAFLFCIILYVFLLLFLISIHFAFCLFFCFCFSVS